MFGLAWYDGFRWNRIDSSAGAPVQRIQAAKRFGSHQLILRCDRKWYVGDRNGFAFDNSCFAHEVAQTSMTADAVSAWCGKPDAIELQYE